MNERTDTSRLTTKLSFYIESRASWWVRWFEVVECGGNGKRTHSTDSAMTKLEFVVRRWKGRVTQQFACTLVVLIVMIVVVDSRGRGGRGTRGGDSCPHGRCTSEDWRSSASTGVGVVGDGEGERDGGGNVGEPEGVGLPFTSQVRIESGRNAKPGIVDAVFRQRRYESNTNERRDFLRSLLHHGALSGEFRHCYKVHNTS